MTGSKNEKALNLWSSSSAQVHWRWQENTSDISDTEERVKVKKRAIVNNIKSVFSRQTVAGDKVDELINDDRKVVIRQRLTAQIVWGLHHTDNQQTTGYNNNNTRLTALFRD